MKLKIEKFKILENGFDIDDKNIFEREDVWFDLNYFCFKEIKNLKTKNEEKSCYFKDYENIYCDNSLLEDFDYDTFVVDGELKRYDKNHKFYRMNIVKNNSI